MLHTGSVVVAGEDGTLVLDVLELALRLDAGQEHLRAGVAVVLTERAGPRPGLVLHGATRLLHTARLVQAQLSALPPVPQHNTTK